MDSNCADISGTSRAIENAICREDSIRRRGGAVESVDISRIAGNRRADNDIAAGGSVNHSPRRVAADILNCRSAALGRLIEHVVGRAVFSEQTKTTDNVLFIAEFKDIRRSSGIETIQRSHNAILSRHDNAVTCSNSYAAAVRHGNRIDTGGIAYKADTAVKQRGGAGRCCAECNRTAVSGGVAEVLHAVNAQNLAVAGVNSNPRIDVEGHVQLRAACHAGNFNVRIICLNTGSDIRPVGCRFDSITATGRVVLERREHCLQIIDRSVIIDNGKSSIRIFNGICKIGLNQLYAIISIISCYGRHTEPGYIRTYRNTLFAGVNFLNKIRLVGGIFHDILCVAAD